MIHIILKTNEEITELLCYILYTLLIITYTVI